MVTYSWERLTVALINCKLSHGGQIGVMIKWKKKTLCQNNSKIKYQNRRKRQNRKSLKHKYVMSNISWNTYWRLQHSSDCWLLSKWSEIINKNVNIWFIEHDTFLEYPSTDTLIFKRLEVFKSLWEQVNLMTKTW
jgi:hypothetical protein